MLAPQGAAVTAGGEYSQSDDSKHQEMPSVKHAAQEWQGAALGAPSYEETAQ